jgi:hypothetical protein
MGVAYSMVQGIRENTVSTLFFALSVGLKW